MKISAPTAAASLAAHVALEEAVHGVAGAIAEADDLTGHEAETETHGATGEVVGTSGVSVQTRFAAVDPTLFHIRENWSLDDGGSNCVNTTAASGYTNGEIQLPHGATVIQFSGVIRTDDGMNAISCALYRCKKDGSSDEMARINTMNDGYEMVVDDSISNPVIDNENYTYHMVMWNTNSTNAGFAGGYIKYTVTVPFP